MRLYRIGDTGEPVRDIQDRLGALGFATAHDPAGDFGDGTRIAVIAFQRAKGLSPDGIVGPDTWMNMVAAGYRLGDRMLYRRVPMMRGDDVAQLQQRLNALGFDSGKVDGIFGPDTLRGLLDFQSNRGMAEDGIAGPAVVAELALMARATQKPGREVVRDHQWLASLPPTVAGQRIYIDSACRTDDEALQTWLAATAAARVIKEMGGVAVLSRSEDTRPPERVRAVRANRLAVDVVLGFALAINSSPAIYSFATELSSSAAGALLAAEISARLDLEAKGRATPILKHTRAPAVVVTAVEMDAAIGRVAAEGLQQLFASAPV